MTPDDARALAEAELENAKSLNASHEHPESLKRAKLAGVILDLCQQLEAVATYPIPTGKAMTLPEWGSSTGPLGTHGISEDVKPLAEHYKPAKAKK
jgi:hypothetical protein